VRLGKPINGDKTSTLMYSFTTSSPILEKGSIILGIPKRN
jgi:hypothetical protein